MAGSASASYRITEAEVLPGGSGVVSLTLRQTDFGRTSTGDFVVQDGKEATA